MEFFLVLLANNSSSICFEWPKEKADIRVNSSLILKIIVIKNFDNIRKMQLILLRTYHHYAKNLMTLLSMKWLIFLHKLLFPKHHESGQNGAK